MADVDNDDGNGRTGTGSVGDTRGNDDNNNNNEDDDEDDDSVGSTTNNALKMTSEEALSPTCKPISETVTQLSSTVSTIQGRF